jgi:hypothetical protein
LHEYVHKFFNFAAVYIIYNLKLGAQRVLCAHMSKQIRTVNKRAVPKVTSGELLTKQAMRKNYYIVVCGLKAGISELERPSIATQRLQSERIRQW